MDKLFGDRIHPRIGQPYQISTFHFNGAGIFTAAAENMIQRRQGFVEYHADIFAHGKRSDATDLESKLGFHLLRSDRTQILAFDAHGIGQFFIMDTNVSGYRRQDPMGVLDPEHHCFEQIVGEMGNSLVCFVHGGDRRMLVDRIGETAILQHVDYFGVDHRLRYPNSYPSKFAYFWTGTNPLHTQFICWVSCLTPIYDARTATIITLTS
jgi:hypothetical protein